FFVHRSFFEEMEGLRETDSRREIFNLCKQRTRNRRLCRRQFAHRKIWNRCEIGTRQTEKFLVYRGRKRNHAHYFHGKDGAGTRADGPLSIALLQSKGADHCFSRRARTIAEPVYGTL